MTQADSTARLRSLGLRTDLIFHKYSGIIEDKDEYFVIKTPSRPTYYWGNFLIMNDPPREGDYDSWVAIFEKEIGPCAERGFFVITWDNVDGEKGEIQQFVDAGYDIEVLSTLTANHVQPPPKYDPNLIVRPLRSDRDWEDYIDIHFDPAWRYGDPDSQRKFIASGRDSIRAMTEAGLGTRFGVEVDGRLVADLGVYREGKLARFNNVATHRDFQRRGICSTLVYEASRRTLEMPAIETLVMQADDAYHAGQIYESIGFRCHEKFVNVNWYEKD